MIILGIICFLVIIYYTTNTLNFGTTENVNNAEFYAFEAGQYCRVFEPAFMRPSAVQPEKTSFYFQNLAELKQQFNLKPNENNPDILEGLMLPSLFDQTKFE